MKRVQRIRSSAGREIRGLEVLRTVRGGIDGDAIVIGDPGGDGKGPK